MVRRDRRDRQGKLVLGPLVWVTRAPIPLWCCTTQRSDTLPDEMPTTRPRLMVTETDELAAALDAAAARWPKVGSRRELLLRLVEQGRNAIERERAEETERRRAAIRATSGALTGAFEPGYLDRLRDDWPA